MNQSRIDGICTYLDVSTKHVPRRYVEGEAENIIATYDAGCFLYVSDALDPDEVPEAIKEINDLAVSLGASLVRIDRDGADWDDMLGDYSETYGEPAGGRMEATAS